jgi:hypothetical protein
VGITSFYHYVSSICIKNRLCLEHYINFCDNIVIIFNNKDFTCLLNTLLHCYDNVCLSNKRLSYLILSYILFNAIGKLMTFLLSLSKLSHASKLHERKKNPPY